MARRIGQREIRALTTLFTARALPARIGALLVLAVAAWAWWNEGRAAPGALTSGLAIHGTVVGIADGDTLTLLDADRREYRLRLAFIDAPEKAQPYGNAAKQALSDRVYRKVVDAEVIDVDRYQRGVVLIRLDGEDINYAQVKDGLAWHYTRYAGKQSRSDFEAYEAALQAARTGRLGLWQQPGAEPPWDFRRNKRAAE
ncbi:thermonuclease family protein [Jeongeupia naejangsanensis]|uniref:Thermonuclease family protein n=1 Tax=Jeongeupia naejangsanensis TaxID=613195 RepID=A0ABS2BLD7_9NEIS|nr:thermonuclease family protein [Jeongeupia naejangsanensis]MBM3116270.1 thermonuclease family protein [Jeongeupia naejangsanensis]